MKRIAGDFDIVLCPDGHFRFAHLRGHRIILSFYGRPNCSACIAKYEKRLALPEDVKKDLFLFAVFFGYRQEYKEVISPGRGVIELFDPAGNVYRAYCPSLPAPKDSSRENVRPAAPYCVFPVDFMIDESLVICRSTSGLPGCLTNEEITAFARAPKS